MKRNLLLSIGTAVVASRIARSISNINADGILGRVGLARNRSHIAENLMYLGAGVVVGAGTALLLAPATGRDTRARMGKKLDQLGRVAADAVEAVENHVPGLKGHHESGNERAHH
jgi:hypothetical protein